MQLHQPTQADAVLRVLGSREEGVDVFEISAESDCNLKDLRIVLEDLQNHGRVFSGLRKEDGYPSIFKRLYFIVSLP